MNAVMLTIVTKGKGLKYDRFFTVVMSYVVAYSITEL